MYLQDWHIEELRKCANDFKYWCENYVKITHSTKGLVPFVLYEFQERTINNFEAHQFNIVRKFRQAGLTTVAVIWALWKAMFFFNQKILIVSKTDREAVGVGKIINSVRKHFPDWMVPEMTTDADHEKEFAETESSLWFYTASASRSKSLTYLIVDEAAFIQKMEERWKDLYPTLSGGGKCIVISTVNGISGDGAWYYEQYIKAEDKKNQFNLINLSYKEHPEYKDEIWERKTRANIGERAWAQEYCGDFLGTGDSYISGKILTEFEKMCIDPVHKMFEEWDTITAEQMTEEDLLNPSYKKGALWVWEEPQKNTEYIISADSAEGGGLDYSAFHVIDVKEMKQVAEFYSNIIPTYRYAQVLYHVGNYYNQAQMFVERNGHGLAVLNRLVEDLNYPNLYYEIKKTGNNSPGFSTDKNIRPIICETMQTCFFNKLLRVRSLRLIRELKNFIYIPAKQRPEARRGKTDDLVMSLAIGLYMADASKKNTPYGLESSSKISAALTGRSFEQIRKEVVEGLPEDFEAFESKIFQKSNLEPLMIGSINRKKDFDILKEFDL